MPRGSKPKIYPEQMVLRVRALYGPGKTQNEIAEILGTSQKVIWNLMRRHTYRPMDEAPKDGTPIVGVCGGVETAVAYDDGPVLNGWFYWDEDEGGTTYQKAKPQPTEWRALF